MLRNRPLLGRVTRWSWDYEEDIPGCSHFEMHQTARKLGFADGLLIVEQLPSGLKTDVLFGVSDRELRLGPWGVVAAHTVILPWFCNQDARIRAHSKPDFGPPSNPPNAPQDFAGACADNPEEACYGLRTPRSTDTESAYTNVRIPSCQALRSPCIPHIRGARFGERHFERVAKIHERKTYATPFGDTGIRTIDETWKVTFSRCPQPKPC